MSAVAQRGARTQLHWWAWGGGGVVGTVTSRDVDTGRGMTLRPIGVSFPVLVIAAPVLLLGLGVVISGPGGVGNHVVGLLGPAFFSALYLFGWYRRGVRLAPSCLVVRNLFASRTIAWDEIDGVRVEVGSSSDSSCYGTPLLALCDGSELRLGQLTASSRSRSSPARQVEVIGRYLNRYGSQPDRPADGATGPADAPGTG